VVLDDVDSGTMKTRSVVGLESVERFKSSNRMRRLSGAASPLLQANVVIVLVST
jgi:hypothetical protein